VLLDLDGAFWWGHHLRGVLAVIACHYREAAAHFADPRMRDLRIRMAARGVTVDLP